MHEGHFVPTPWSLQGATSYHLLQSIGTPIELRAKGAGLKMREEFVNPFLSPAMTVWEQELGDPLDLIAAEAISSSYTTSDITAVIGVTGKLRGSVLYEMNRETALSVASKMVGEPVDTLDEMSMSALGELANMITGNAATLLTQAGYTCDISPPVMLEPRGVAITSQANGTQIKVTFRSPMGDLNIRIGLTEAG